MKKLNAYTSNKDASLAPVFKQAFLNECSNDKCDDAIEIIMSALLGSTLFGPDILDIFYKGDVSGYNYVGYADMIA